MVDNARKVAGRINCIGDPDNQLCAEMMTAAAAARQADAPLMAECLRVGQSSFNQSRPPEQRRAHGCTYSYLSTGGPNSKGEKWKKLLPAACLEGTYVGRDGLDCCIGKPLTDASLYRECAPYYPKN